MKKRSLIFLFAVLLIFGACNGGNNKTDTDTQDSIVHTAPATAEDVQDISEVITRFVRAYASRDNEKANKLIHPDLGLSIIYRPGAADNFVHRDSIDFASPVPSHYSYPRLENKYALTFEKLPVFSCDDFKWDKEGFVCDTTSHPSQLTQIALFANEFNDGEYSAADLDKIKQHENQSFRVIVTADEPLIFHIQQYDGAWYVTVLDRAYGGCDA